MKTCSDQWLKWGLAQSAAAQQVTASIGISEGPAAAQVLAAMKNATNETPSKESPKKEIGCGEHNKQTTNGDKQATNVLVTDAGAGNTASINERTNADNANSTVLEDVQAGTPSEGAEESADAGAGNTVSINKRTKADNAKSTVLSGTASEGAEEFAKNEIGAGAKSNLAKEDQTPANVLDTNAIADETVSIEETEAERSRSLQQRTDAEVEGEMLTADLPGKWFFAKHIQQGWLRMMLLEPDLFEYRVNTFKGPPSPYPVCKDTDRKTTLVRYEQQYVAHGNEKVATEPDIWEEGMAGTVACLCLPVPACACLYLPVSVCACVCLPVSACV
jgi:hypothetical protein